MTKNFTFNVQKIDTVFNDVNQITYYNNIAHPNASSDSSSAINNSSFTQLRLVLERLYEDEASSRRIVVDTGMNDSLIDFAGSATNRWTHILSECSKQNMLDKLISIVRSEYGDNEELNKAWQEYRNSQKQ